jgi:hypothetical protein
MSVNFENAPSLTRDQIVDMSLDNLVDAWSEDVRIDYSTSNLDEIILNVGILHAKYLKIMVIHNDLLHESERALKRAASIRAAYYSGKISREEEKKYGWEPYQQILTGKQLQDVLDIDPILTAGQNKVNKHTDIVEACKLINKELGNRTYQIRAAIDWQKVRNGFST